MAHLAIRPRLIRVVAAAITASTALCIITTTTAPGANADAVAYLLEVTVRPGYNFANADAALAYGHGVCDKVGAGETYGQVMGEVESDFNTADEFQASYLISQAVNELCPALIWQLRNSAAHHRPPAATG
jgi:hypothetical protein